MDKSIKEIIITTVLLLVLVGIIFHNFKGESKKKPRKTSPSFQEGSGEEVSSSVSRSVDKQTIGLQRQRAETLTWVRDPFQYLETEIDKSYHTDALMLKGISIGRDKPGFAFINSDIVRVGDRIGGYEVIQIQKDKVLLKRGTQIFYLTLPEE